MLMSWALGLITGDGSQVVEWSLLEDSPDYLVLNVTRRNSIQYAESNHRAQDSTLYYSLKKVGITNLIPEQLLTISACAGTGYRYLMDNVWD